MLQIKSNAQLDKEKAEADAARIELEQSEVLDDSLSAYIQKCWIKAVEAKKPIEDQLLRNKRQIKGLYEADKLAAIKSLRVPEIFILLTHVKQANAEAWIEEILFQPNSLPWDISPTPIPDLPDEIKAGIMQSIITNYVELSMQTSGSPFADPSMIQEFISQNLEAIKDEARLKVLEYAKKTADRMRDRINDQLTEGGWYKAISDAIPNIVMKTGFVKGPIYRKRRTRTPHVNPQTGAMYVTYDEKIIPTYESRSPFSIYPAPDSTGINDGFLIDRIQLTPVKLQELIGVEGYRDDEIRAVLREHGDGTLRDWLKQDVPDDDIKSIDEKDASSSVTIYDSDKIDCIEFWGAVQGSKLIEYGMSESEISDKDMYYNCVVWKIGDHIIKAMLNDDINGNKPYYKASFYDEKETFWGVGLPEIITPEQQGCNACARAIIANVGISAGPMVERNIDRVKPEDRTDDTIYPLKVFDSTNEDMISQAPAYNFYQPNFIADRMIVVFETFSRMADEHSGVPAWAHGNANTGSGAGRTAQGLSMLMSGAARGIKDIIKSIDDNIIAPSVQNQYFLNIEEFENYGLICDFQIHARGSVAMLAKEQQAVRKIELLNMTANPLDSQIIGIDGRRYMLRDVFKALDMDVDNIMPDTPLSEDKLKEMQMIQQMSSTTNSNAPSPTSTDMTGARVQGGDTQTIPSGAYGRAR